jgi:uncharacterized membrane protein
MADRVSAVFDTAAQAEEAVYDLRCRGVRDDQLSLVAHSQDDTTVTITPDESAADDQAQTVARGAGLGVVTGAGIGGLFGLAAFAIPGIGPFITAGALGSALGSIAAGGAAAGAVVGGTAGAITGALARVGYSEEEAQYYGQEVERGGVLLAVDTGSNITVDQARDVLALHGGRMPQSRSSGESSTHRADED